LQLADGSGVTIVRVVPGSAAETARLKADDVLLKVGDDLVNGVQHAVDLVRARAPRSVVRLSVLRDGKNFEIEVVLGVTTLREWRPLYLDARNARSIRWLAREHAITILPAVSSLKALRHVGRLSAAPRAMIGFGNPLLDGPDLRYADLAKLARGKQRCAEARGEPKVAISIVPRGGVGRVEMRGGLANLAQLKAAVPLPETADELCRVADDVKADAARDIHLGSRATERELKQLSASGELAKYRMVHFATHGALAGQLKGTDEPGLILNPPETQTEEDDGYLSASEIAALKLDADWVILSACNTAAGSAPNAEALSGLARAFIYAGARALLVSHWEVNSDAAVKLITTAVREMAADLKVGRAEAMRRAMLALIDKGTLEGAHPAYWAPFVLVGEGAAGR
jgi:CHAT domain-containing protein